MVSLKKLSRKHKVYLAIGWMLLCGCAVKAISGDGGWVHLESLKASQESLEAFAYRLETENERMRLHLRRLESDDLYLEKVARERLGWVKAGEFVYRAGQDDWGGPNRNFPRAARGG